ncbi:hypothetical protein Q0F99_09915 [Rathayibacter oskolensis]|nr:hypothetical protein [Rathayibacter oskolensis]WKK73120.1 hypothetical protein Q0F99_09915 [Rathayibacter oskolensis]
MTTPLVTAKAQARSTSIWRCATASATPRPVVTPPRYSPSTAPRIAAGTPTCSAVIVAGTAAMACTLTICAQRPPR